MIGFIGIGSMGGAIARGLLASGIPAQDIVVNSRSPQTREAFAGETGAVVVPSNTGVVDRAGTGAIIVVAVKPYAITEVLEEIREAAASNHSVIVSVAAGIPIADLESHLDAAQPVVRAMPNVGAAVGASMTALAGNRAGEANIPGVVGLFNTIGSVTQIEEKDFAIFSAIAGCSPAFTFEYIDAMARAAVYNGMPKAKASRIAAQAVMGAAKLLLETEGSTPANLADSVQSPGGTTVAGVVELEQAGFGAAVVRAVQASVDRDSELRR